MRIGFRLISLIVLLLVISTACASDGSDAATTEDAKVDGPALVMFYTDNWAPWMAMMPIVDGLSEEFEGRVSAIQLNVALSTNSRLQKEFGLSGHPSFVLLDKDNQIIHSYFGPQSENLLREAMELVSTN